MKTEYAPLNNSTDELYEILGEFLLEKEFGAKPPTRQDKRNSGFSWFISNFSELKKAICTNTLMMDLRREKDRTEIFGVICDLIIQRFGGIPVAALGTLILNYGVEKLCENHED